MPTSQSYQDTVSAVLPLYHIYGMVLIFLNSFAEGCKLVTMTHFSPNIYLEMLNEHKPSILYTAPPIVHFLNGYSSLTNLDFVRVIVCGAAPLAETDIARFNTKFSIEKNKSKIIQGYGMTESGPLTHCQRVSKDTRNGGIGWPISNTQCRIVSLDDGKTNLGPGEVGELWIKGPQLMKGYHNNAEATINTLVENGWLKTGDIGYYNHDKQFFITDRLKELIKVILY